MKQAHLEKQYNKKSITDIQSVLQQIIDKVIRVADPEKIFLLGTLINRCTHENIFSDSSNTLDRATHFTLLILISESNGKHETQNIIENSCRSIASLTAMVLCIHVFNSLALANNLFSKKVYYSADEIYDAGRICLIAPSFEEEPEDVPEESNEFINRANGFHASAELHLLRKELKLAAFMLHQTFEQLCLAKIKMNMGIKADTHNLDKLYRYVRCFSHEFAQVFPRNNENEERLFKILKDAYIQSRYFPDYFIKEADIKILLDRIRHIL